MSQLRVLRQMCEAQGMIADLTAEVETLEQTRSDYLVIQFSQVKGSFFLIVFNITELIT